MTRRLLTATLVVVALIAAACGGGGDDEEATTTTKRQTTTTADPRVPAPLSGQLMDPELAGRPVVSVKVDNSNQGRPQAGIDKADVLFEEMVEGSVTRFIAVFHSQDSDLIGPIRSMRPSDPAIVAPFGGVFVFSDGVPQVVSRLRGLPVRGVFEMQGADPFVYPSGRQRPYKTFGKSERLREEAADDATAPPALAMFLRPDETFTAPGATTAATATLAFGSRTTAGFEWDDDDGVWLRSTNGAPHTLADGERLAFTTVIIQYVRYVSAGYNDSAGTRVEEAQTVGSGDGVALIDGQQVPIKWSKTGPTAMTQFTDANGAPLRLPAGRVMVLLPPIGAATNIAAPVPSTTTTTTTS